MKGIAVLYALLAAVFFAASTPLSKLLLADIPAVYMAAFLYLGAGIGVGLMYCFRRKFEPKEQRLNRKDLPYVVGMILLDILAPILMMLGIRLGTASEVSLLSSFEIVATTIIALLFFREKVSKKLWIAIALITAASAMLSMDGTDGLRFSGASLLVLMATVCWGLENNCTRSISDKSSYQIVTWKGLFSGGGALAIAFASGEGMPDLKPVLMALVLGFFSYGLSIFLYVRAQRTLGAAKTSAYYAVSPFVGSLMAFLVVGDELTGMYLAALAVMIVGTVFVVLDTMSKG